MKRQLLLVEAMRFTDPRVKLLIAGPPDTPADAADLIAAVERLGLADRVRLDLRFLPRATYAEYVRGAAAVAYLPFDEDSLGYVTMEAALAGKALLTTTDSGGILGLVKQEQTGWIAEPSVESLTHAMNAVFDNTQRTKSYGDAARALWLSLDINWPTTIKRLLK